jgi:hypothetical protein
MGCTMNLVAVDMYVEKHEAGSATWDTHGTWRAYLNGCGRELVALEWITYAALSFPFLKNKT